ncbi:NAD(P)/FAD-dependent oxidoreductase [Aquimarina sp. AU474]|uniref:NAD(P)/FAD-dependent oxidoreductase n=1 Tax=Aquimarina sp. AU474 TaxID=2108529 RepID=UPI000D68AC86|nr:NAD(P)/FAD-dependent oxidoreductase [Aquimarina sp. AU474]
MNKHSHILIVGGGLAGLVSAIHLSQKGMHVVLIEKDTYPKHKVCGEYISNEVLPYFKYLDIDIDAISPVKISKFKITTQTGNAIDSILPLGGFGISRFTLDKYLWDIAIQNGVECINDKVVDISFEIERFRIDTVQNGRFTSDYVIGAYGKQSSLDKSLNRNFSDIKSPWLAVKMHYRADINKETVALHNFEGGYCGLSMVENDAINACYLVHYDSFKRYKDIKVFQTEVLNKNPHLKEFYNTAVPLFEQSITISQVNFQKKKLVDKHIFMTGDAAGLIHPLCGNGMAMAIQSAQIISELLIDNYSKTTSHSRKELENLYKKQWDAAFSKRMYTGRLLQKVLLNANMQELSYTLASLLPSMVPKIIKQTHGNPILC